MPLPPAVVARYILGSPMRRRVGWLGLVGLMIAIASIAACRQLVGITDNPN